MDREILLAPRQRPVEVDDAGDELRLEHPDAAEVEQVEGVIGPRRIIAEMGIAVDDAVTIEGHVPRQEHVMRQLVAAFDMGVGEGQQRLALEPGHAQKPPGRKLIDRHRHVHAVLAFEHRRIKTHVQRFAPVVQFLMQAFDDFGVDFARRDGGVDALVYGEGEPELPEIGIDHRFHVRVLQFAGKPRAVVRQRFVHLAERRRPRRDVFEFGEALLPIGPQFRRHAPLDEQPAHGRRVGLQMPEFRGVFRRQGVGHGGEELRHLHQRPLDAAERGAQLRRVAGPVELEAEIARPGKANGEPADRGRDLGVAAEAPGQPRILPSARLGGSLGFGRAVRFRSLGRFRRLGHGIAQSSSSSSSIRAEIIPSPRSQKAGSVASRPKGAKSSRCRLVPPALSISRYLSLNVPFRSAAPSHSR